MSSKTRAREPIFGTLITKKKEWLPEHHMWERAMELAVVGAIKGNSADRLWLDSSRTDVGSFLWICEQLNFKEPNAIRTLSREAGEDIAFRISVCHRRGT